MLPIDSEVVEYKILVNAAAAIEQLRVATKSAQSFNQEVTLAGQAAKRFSAQNNISMNQSISVLKNMDAVIANVKGDMGVFTDQGARGWSTLGAAAESGSRRAVRSIDAMRIAMGAFVSMILFRAIQAIETFFKTAIEEAARFEDTLYRLQNVERQLSKEGIEISVKGLHEGIKDLQNVFSMFSNESIAELVGNIAITTKELGYTEEHMLKLAAASLILNLNSTEAETALQTQAKITNSLVSPQAKSIGNLGLAFGQAKIEAKAFEMQILQTGESFKDLTEQEKRDIKFQIVLETAGIDEAKDIKDIMRLIKEAGGDLEALGEYFDSNSVKIMENRAAWDDLKVTVGQVIIPFLPALTGLIEGLTKSFMFLKVVIIEVMTSLGIYGTMLHKLFTGQITSLEEYKDAILETATEARKIMVNQLFKEIPDDAPEWFMRGWGKHIKEQAETATGDVEDLAEALEDLGKFEGKVADIKKDMDEALADLDTKRDRKLADLDLKYLRKAEDALRDYNRKVENINADAEQKREDAIRKSREKELEAERDFQNKLWELRMRFLMDLEDALHARDARQIIRLQKQYAIDKEALLRKKKLDDQSRKEDLEAELAQIELQRQRRLEDAKRDYEQKLSDQRKAKQRELDDLALWYDREDADRKLHIQRKLQDLINAWIQEGKITQAGAQNVYDILRTYFGPGGLTDQVYDYMQSQLGAMSIVPTISTPVIAPATTWSGTSPGGGLAGGSSGGTGGSTGGRDAPRTFAEGGTLIATRPMTATFGEVPEAVTFTPLDNPGNNVGRMFGDTSALGGGVLELLLTLSPDLESRIVRKSMDGVADVVVRVNRSKV